MVSTLIKDCNILLNYTTLCDMSIEKVCKEVSHKMEAKKKKLKSLRTEIKKSSRSLEKDIKHQTLT